jgi:hypothetical protein
MTLIGCVAKTLYWWAGLVLICLALSKLIDNATFALTYGGQYTFLIAGFLIGVWSTLVVAGHACPWLWGRKRGMLESVDGRKSAVTYRRS